MISATPSSSGRIVVPAAAICRLIRVAGRCDDILRLVGAEKRSVAVLPLAIGSALDGVPGVGRSQLVQTGPSTVRLRLATTAGTDIEGLWKKATAELRKFLIAQGLAEVEIVRAEVTSGAKWKERKVSPGHTGAGGLTAQWYPPGRRLEHDDAIGCGIVGLPGVRPQPTRATGEPVGVPRG